MAHDYSLDGCSRLALDGAGDDGIVVARRGMPLAPALVRRPAPAGPHLIRWREHHVATICWVDRLEERVTALEQLPHRLDVLTLESSQFRTEVRDEFSA